MVDIADYFTQPLYFGSKTVEFKIGCEIDLLNRLMSLYRQAKGCFGVTDAKRLIPLFRKAITFSSVFGTSGGGVMVQARKAGETESVSFSILKETNSEIIPALLPAIAAQMILEGTLNFSGIAKLPDWLTQDRLKNELSRRNVHLMMKPRGSKSWVAFTAVRQKEPRGGSLVI